MAAPLLPPLVAHPDAFWAGRTISSPNTVQGKMAMVFTTGFLAVFGLHEAASISIGKTGKETPPTHLEMTSAPNQPNAHVLEKRDHNRRRPFFSKLLKRAARHRPLSC